jgi:ketosteroid isomerase-like protein
VSEENVEIVLRQWELWNEGEFDKWAQVHHPNVVVVAPEGWPEGAVSEGIEAWRLQAERLRVTRGSDANFSFDTPMAVAITLKAGKITRAEFFWDVAEALKAAGVSE